MLILRLFRSYIFSKRSESLVRVLAKITLASSFLSVFSLVLVISIMNGFNRNMAKKMLAVEPHISLLQSDVKDMEKLKKDFKDQLQIHDYAQQDLVLRTLDGYFSGAVARGLTSAEMTSLLKRIDATSDRDFVDVNQTLGQSEVIIGGDLARSINVLVGDELTLVAPESLLLPPGEVLPVERVRIVQIIQTQVANFDSKALLYSLDHGLGKLNNTKTIEERLEFFLENPYEVDGLVSELQQKYLKKEAIVDTWKSSNLPLFFALRMEKWAMSSLLSLSVLVTSFSLIMVLLMLINQKRKDIGMIMAMGMSRRKVTFLFTGMGFLLAGLGSLSGLVLAVVVSNFIEKYPVQLPDIYADSTLPAQVNVLQIIFIAICLMLLAFLSAWLPVRKLALGSPSENLRGQTTAD